MNSTVRQFSLSIVSLAILVAGVVAVAPQAAFAQGDANISSVFKGPKVNGGTVMHEHKDGRHVLTWSDDFKIPDTPAPHWQVVDSKGNVYLLNRLKIKDDKVNRSITVPSYVPDVARVQIWCAYAEVVLGEAAFESPIK